MIRKNRFGRGGVFVCQGCDRRTRDAGNGIYHLCPECWELAGLDNQVNDNGGGLDEVTTERDWLFNEISESERPFIKAMKTANGTRYRVMFPG